MKTASKNDEESKKQALIDASAYEGMFGLLDNYITPFALLLGAGNLTIGLLKSLPQLFVAISQPAYRELLLVAVFSLYAMMGPFGVSVWASWIADLVPEKNRGQFFGKMKMISGAVSFGTVLLAGFFLKLFSAETALYGFLAIFAFAIVLRIISYAALSRMSEPEKKGEMRSLDIRRFIGEIKSNGFWPVLVLALVIDLGTYVAAPFFAVYMLRDLHMDYLTFGILSSTMIMAKFLAMPYWGKIAVRLGNKMIMVVTGILIVTTPLLWLFSGSPYYLFFVQIFAGFCWAGFDLAVMSYVINFGSRINRDIRAFGSDTAGCVCNLRTRNSEIQGGKPDGGEEDIL